MKFMVFDTETADKLENTDKSVLAEIGYLFVDTDRDKSFFEYSYIKPEVPMSPGASVVNNITNVDVGYEPDNDGNIKNIPSPTESPVFKRFVGGINKYKEHEDFYVLGFNIDEFDNEVIKRALGYDIMSQVKRIDLYRLSKYLYFTDEGKNKLPSEMLNNLPESISLQYLKYYNKLYKDINKIKRGEILNVGEEHVKQLEIPHSAFSDIASAYVLFLFYYNNYFEQDVKKMFTISNSPIKLDYFQYGYLKGERIEKQSSNKLLNFLTRTDDEDLIGTIAEILTERNISPEVILRANENSAKYIKDLTQKNSHKMKKSIKDTTLIR